MKYKKHPWPSDGVSKKQLDHHKDLIGRKLDRINKDLKDYKRQVRLLTEFLESGPHSKAWELFNLQDQE